MQDATGMWLEAQFARSEANLASLVERCGIGVGGIQTLRRTAVKTLTHSANRLRQIVAALLERRS